eukprot:2282577-Rhodomonas_salina.1
MKRVHGPSSHTYAVGEHQLDSHGNQAETLLVASQSEVANRLFRGERSETLAVVAHASSAEFTP